MEENIQKETEDLQAVRSEGKKKKRIIIILLGLLLLLLCTIFVLYKAGYINFGKKKPAVAITAGDLFPGGKDAEDGLLPDMTPEELKEQMQLAADASSFGYKINAEPYFENGKSEGTLGIENPNYNVYPMVVQITLDDTEEIIYDSGGIKPNQHIETAKLDKQLPAGTYQATATMFVYHNETDECVGKTQAALSITIEN